MSFSSACMLSRFSSSVHRILQARVLEWVAIPFSLIQPIGIFCFGWHVKEIWSLAHIFLEKENIFLAFSDNCGYFPLILLYNLTIAAAAVASVVSDSVWPHRWQPTRLPRPWDSPGKNTGVGCHFLLQCRKVKSESEVAQSCPTPSDPMDCSLPGFPVHGIF